MFRFRPLAIVCLTVSLFSTAFAQGVPYDAEKIAERQKREIAFAEQILTDAGNLRLPENRAYVFAKIGNVLWSADEKRARQLFQNSVNDLLAAQTEAAAEKGNRQAFQNLIYGQQPRWEILNLIANRDAESALEAASKTRPPKIAQALAALTSSYPSQMQYYARSELQNEQRLLALAAEQNPERATKLLRESLKKGFTYETVNLLKKIYQKDAAAANSLAEEVGEKFLSVEYTAENYQDFENLSYFVNEIGQTRPAEEKGLQVSDKLLRGLADKMTGFWLNPEVKSQYGYGSLNTVEKFFPDRAARVKQKFERINDQHQTPQQQEYQKILQSDISAEEMINRAEKYPRSWRGAMYRQAADKMSKSGNVAQAEKLLTDNLSEEEAENHLFQFNYNLTTQAISEGKFDEANALISRLPNENYRVSAYTQLASAIFYKDQKENRKWALSVLDQARAGISDVPESDWEMSSLINIANICAMIEPARAFSMIEPLIAPLNEISQANAVLAKHRNYGNFRQGEFQIGPGQGAIGVHGLENILQQLKNEDFDRVIQFTNSFSRLDNRIALQIQLVNEGLSTQNSVSGVLFKGISVTNH